MKKILNYKTLKFGSSRQFTIDIGKLGLKKHHMKALIEIDVTDSRKKLRSRRNNTGEKISFTSWILKCIGKAVSEYRQVQALRKGKNKLVIFEDIDISFIVEKKVNDERVPIPLVIRNINNLKLTEINSEIENAGSKDIKNANDFIIEKDRKKEPVNLFLFFPQFVRLIIWKILLSNPQRVKKMMGTVVVTSLGMIGKISGWILPYSIHPLCFALGSIVNKPGVKKNSVEIREFLQMTILIDHDVIDGAPAARFVSRLVKLIETGYEL